MKRPRDIQSGDRPKRTKASQACAPCRKHKTRCEVAADPATVRCHRCHVLGIPCSFDPSAADPSPAPAAVPDALDALGAEADSATTLDAVWSAPRPRRPSATALASYAPSPAEPGTPAGPSTSVHAEQANPYGAGMMPPRFNAGTLVPEDLVFVAASAQYYRQRAAGGADWTEAPMSAMYELLRRRGAPSATAIAPAPLANTGGEILSEKEIKDLLALFETHYAPWTDLPPRPTPGAPTLDAFPTLARCAIACRHLPAARFAVAQPRLQKAAEHAVLVHTFDASSPAHAAPAAVHALLLLALWAPAIGTLPGEVLDGGLIAAGAVRMAMALSMDRAAERVLEMRVAAKGHETDEKLAQIEEELYNARLWGTLCNVEWTLCAGTTRTPSSVRSVADYAVTDWRELPGTVRMQDARDLRLGMTRMVVEAAQLGCAKRLAPQPPRQAAAAPASASTSRPEWPGMSGPSAGGGAAQPAVNPTAAAGQSASASVTKAAIAQFAVEVDEVLRAFDAARNVVLPQCSLTSERLQLDALLLQQHAFRLLVVLHGLATLRARTGARETWMHDLDRGGSIFIRAWGLSVLASAQAAITGFLDMVERVYPVGEEGQGEGPRTDEGKEEDTEAEEAAEAQVTAPRVLSPLSTAPDHLFAALLFSASLLLVARYSMVVQWHVHHPLSVTTPSGLLSRLAAALERLALTGEHAPRKCALMVNQLKRVWEEKVVAPIVKEAEKEREKEKEKGKEKGTSDATRASAVAHGRKRYEMSTCDFPQGRDLEAGDRARHASQPGVQRNDGARGRMRAPTPDGDDDEAMESDEPRPVSDGGTVGLPVSAERGSAATPAFPSTPTSASASPFVPASPADPSPFAPASFSRPDLGGGSGGAFGGLDAAAAMGVGVDPGLLHGAAPFDFATAIFPMLSGGPIGMAMGAGMGAGGGMGMGIGAAPPDAFLDNEFWALFMENLSPTSG